MTTLQLKALTLQGFRSFKTGTCLILENLPAGLYHVTGNNGAGKSTLFSGLYWGTYGAHPDGLKGPALKNWDGEQCWVHVTYDDLSITRTQSPNSLKANDADIAQDELNKLLPVDADTFLRSVYFPQEHDAFIDLRPDQRLALYSSVMSLDLWETASDNASAASSDLEDAIARQREQVAALEAEIATLVKQDFTDAIKKWDANQRTYIGRLQAKVNLFRHQVAKCQVQVDKTAEAHQEYLDLLAEFRKLEHEVASHNNETSRVRDRIEQLKETNTCPTCGQPWDDIHDKQAQLADLLGKVDDLHKKVIALRDQRDSLRRRSQALSASYNNAQKAREELATAQGDFRAEQRALDRAQGETNPYTELEDRRKKDLAQARQQLVKVKQGLDQDIAFAQGVKFWSKGFKDVRLSLIEESLQQLNLEVNECVEDLGLSGWTLTFDVERETKRGTIKRGFQCMVHNPNTDKDLPWEAWSGGERQRLRLACSMGVSNLICAHRGISPNFELWDEPTTSLTTEGIGALLDCLAARAQQQNKRIFLADHHVFDYGGFAGLIEVLKTDGQSHIKIRS